MAGNWKESEFDFSERSDRVTLKLEVGQVVYIPGAADIRNENTDQAELKSMSKEERILEYIRQNGNISTQKVMDLCNYKSRTGARNLLEKLIKSGKIEKVGENTNTIIQYWNKDSGQCWSFLFKSDHLSDTRNH